MQKATNFLIGAFVFLSSTFYIPGQNFHNSQAILFKIAGMLFFALFLCLPPLRKIRNVWIGAFLAYAIVIFMVVEKMRPVAIVSLVNIFLVVILYYTFSNYLDGDKAIYRAIQWIIAANVVFVAFQLLKIDPLTLNDQGKPNSHLVGLFGHPMNMGIFCSVVLPYVFSKNKIWAGLTFILLVASKSYISVALGIVGLLVYLFFVHKKLFKISVVVVFIGTLLLSSYMYFCTNQANKQMIANKFIHRWDVGYPLLRTSLSNPWHGYGLGSFKFVSQKAMSPEAMDLIGWVDVPWCDYSGCTVEMGIAILFIFFGFFEDTLKRFKASIKTKESYALFASLCTVPIGMIFHSYMNYINVGVICVALFSLLEIKIKEES